MIIITMKNDISTIRQLLDKYYDAETDEQEEDILYEYFSGVVAPEFEMFKPHFLFNRIGYDDGKELRSDFNEIFMKNISATNLKPVKSKRLNLFRYAGVAAAAVAVFVMFLLINKDEDVSEEEYAQVIESLILISEKMETASHELRALSNIENSLNTIDAFKALEEYGKHFINQ